MSFFEKHLSFAAALTCFASLPVPVAETVYSTRKGQARIRCARDNALQWFAGPKVGRAVGKTICVWDIPQWGAVRCSNERGVPIILDVVADMANPVSLF